MEAKITVENVESALKMKEIIGNGANRRAGIDLHLQRWWPKESTINKRKIFLEEIHNLEEVRRIATAIGQGKHGSLTKWESTKDKVVTWSDLKHVEPPKLFPYKGFIDVLPTSVILHAWELTTSDRSRACGNTGNLKNILTGCENALRSYTWRHNEVLEIFAEAAKICCETANKALNKIPNRAIPFVK